MDFHKIAKLFKEPKSCFTIEEFLEGVFIHLDFKDLIACSRVWCSVKMEGPYLYF